MPVGSVIDDVKWTPRSWGQAEVGGLWIISKEKARMAYVVRDCS